MWLVVLFFAGVVSPSSRGRGLKPYGPGLAWMLGMSPSSRGRGLKLYATGLTVVAACRPLHEGVD